MEHKTQWVTFDELCLSLHVTPTVLTRMIRKGDIVGKCVGRQNMLRSDWRYIDPIEEYKVYLQTKYGALRNQYGANLEELPILTSRDFAYICGFTESRVRGLIKRGVLKPSRMGKFSLFSLRQLRDFRFRRENKTHEDHRPSMETILTCALEYLEKQAEHGKLNTAIKMDDHLEGMLQRLLRLKEPQRTKSVQEFHRRWKAAKDITDLLATAELQKLG